MNKVEPIRNMELIEECKRVAREHDAEHKGGFSWEFLLCLGINAGLRISDLSRLKVKDVSGNYIVIRAQKTGKEHRVALSAKTQKMIKKHIKGRKPDEWLFPSRCRDRKTKEKKHIGRQRAYQVLTEIAREAGVTERVGTHSLRKTFAYHLYKQEKNVIVVQTILGHDARRDTLGYIGVRDDEVDAAVMRFGL